MSQGNGKSVRGEYIAKIVLTSIFLGGFAFFIVWMLTAGPGLDIFNLSTVDLVLLAFSTFRLGRLVAYDRVMEPFRQFFNETVRDPTGAGDTVVPKGVGFQQSLGQLICCPICAGTWIAALLTYLLYLFPGPTRVFLVMTGVVGAAELLNAAAEAWSWTGQQARTIAGEKMLQREREQERGRTQQRMPERDHGYEDPDQTGTDRLAFRERQEDHTAEPQEEVVKSYPNYR